MSINLDKETRKALFEYLLRLGDDSLILGHRLSEWCGHAPILEEDVALANISLDCIGFAEALLRLAGEVEGEGRSEDDLTYFREEFEFRNLKLLEQPNGHFGDTIARQFLFDSFALPFYTQLTKSEFKPLADIAAKGVVELTYHLRHSRTWLHRLGDGTEESHDRVQASTDHLWMYTGELFFMDEVDRILIEKNMAPDLETVRAEWQVSVSREMETATLTTPGDDRYMTCGGRLGRHDEHLGHLLAEMQILARSHPGTAW